MYSGFNQQLNTRQERVGVLDELRWPFYGCQRPGSRAPTVPSQLGLWVITSGTVVA